jgi:hypothetical protein
MGIRSLKSASISTGVKRSKVWDQSAVVNNNSFESIATINVGAGGAATAVFSSIPSTYKHLQIRGIARTNRDAAALENISMVFNSDTFSSDSNYGFHGLDGDGGSASSFASAGAFARQIPALVTSVSAGANMFGTFVIDILDYANANKNKTVRSLTGSEINTTGGSVRLMSGIYTQANVISTITMGFTIGGGAFNQYSSIALYGIKG